MRLNDKREAINDLNVFPIPDGDTGDNMYMTLEAGIEGASGGSIGEVAEALSRGMLLGARGNSGVILSRICAGIAEGLKGLESASVGEFGAAMARGVDSSYKAVGTPVEGTMLTVFREGVAGAGSCGAQDLEAWLDTMVCEMQASLKRTPDLLPVLKEAGVVDSGGAGLLCIGEGMREALDGTISNEAGADRPTPRSVGKINLDDFGPDTPLTFGYCTEFLLRLQTAKVGDVDAFDDSVIKQYLEGAGDSLVYFRDGSIVKVHVHTKTPGDVLSHVQRWGEFLTVKIENMTLQHSEVKIQDRFSGRDDELLAHRSRYAVVAVASGKGLCDTFREAGVDRIVEGGQTMNPSAADFIDAFRGIAAEHIIVFPNNSNIILAARQAAEMYRDADVIVLPSKDIGSGYVAAASLDRDCPDPAQVVQDLTAVMEGVVTGMVSRAIRDTAQDGLDVHKGDWVGFEHKRMVACSKDRTEAALATAEKLCAGEHDVAIVFYGADVPAEEAAALQGALEKSYPRTEIMLTDGGQGVYDYIIVLC